MGRENRVKDIADYSRVGLKVGIEIHQQLNTGKLFCGCSSDMADKRGFRAERMLRVTAGESGRTDKAALFEHERSKSFVYYASGSCLVELDEEPPHGINTDALRTALQFASLVKGRIVDEVRVMRKIVIDGSNTSGFQRTMVVALNGSVRTEKGKTITIPTICLEEDAAKIIARGSAYDEYELSRLGVPLIEVATDPLMSDPHEVGEVALHLGTLLRSLNVKRGLGTIRQDLNVSVKGGSRVEIKGAQDLRLIPRIIEYEVERQLSLVDIAKRIKTISSFDGSEDVTDVFVSTESSVLKSAIRSKGVVLALKVRGFRGLLGRRIQPGRRLGSEISDYVKAYAGLGGIFHSDELPAYGISDKEVKRVKNILGCRGDDAFIMVAGERQRCVRGIEAAIMRMRDVPLGVLKEVRKVKKDGTTVFLRPMPGSARMYPETDILPVKTAGIVLEDVESLVERQKKLQKSYGFSKEEAALILRRLPEFGEIVSSHRNVPVKLIFHVFMVLPKEVRKRFKVAFSEEEGKKASLRIVDALNEMNIAREVLPEIMTSLIRGKNVRWADFKGIKEDDVRREIRAVVRGSPDAPLNALMGVAMKRLRGKVAGSVVMRILKEEYKK